jgi:hypothetical protein
MPKQLHDMTEPEMRTYFNLLARATETALPDGALFVLLVFDDPGIAQYVSNCSRENMVQALRETADRLEAREDIPR